MRVVELFRPGRPVFSFEFFLPKTPEGLERFRAEALELKRLEPSFVTLTYGAGGSARGKTVETAGMLQNELGLLTVAHLACIGHSRAEIRELLESIRGRGIENIMALRGDRPRDRELPPEAEWEYKHAADLVRHIRETGGFCVGVAGYPEKHPEAPSLEEDLRRLKEKADAGADYITTQLFFENEDYVRFVEKVRGLGLRQPVLPGLMPVTNYGQLTRFASMCGARIPEELRRKLEPVQDDPEAVVRIGIEWTLRQARELLDQGAPGIHFYTLNRSHATFEILSRLKGLKLPRS